MGDGISVFGVVLRGSHDAGPHIALVELLDSQTTTLVRLGDVKIDAISFLYEVDCTGSRYRLAGQVMYARSGQPITQTHIDNPMAEGPLASYLDAACGRDLTSEWTWGPKFSSMDGFLSAADTILEPRRAALPPVTITAIPRSSD